MRNINKAGGNSSYLFLLHSCYLQFKRLISAAFSFCSTLRAWGLSSSLQSFFFQWVNCFSMWLSLMFSSQSDTEKHRTSLKPLKRLQNGAFARFINLVDKKALRSILITVTSALNINGICRSALVRTLQLKMHLMVICRDLNFKHHTLLWSPTPAVVCFSMK